jgi:hypothetical protein
LPDRAGGHLENLGSVLRVQKVVVRLWRRDTRFQFLDPMLQPRDHLGEARELGEVDVGHAILAPFAWAISDLLVMARPSCQDPSCADRRSRELAEESCG